jgi:hypothetical protein
LNLLQEGRSFLNDCDRTLISNVIHAHDACSAIPQTRRAIKDLFPSSSLNTSFNVSDVFESTIHMYTFMQSFISSLPDFRILTIYEQQSLFDRNLHGIIALCSVHFFHATGIITNPKCMETFSSVYGLDMMLQAKCIVKKLDSDLTIIELMLIILAFSSNCFIIHRNVKLHSDSSLNGTFRLLGSQNVYVELLWKYMIHQYGYHDTVLRFSRLIEIFLDLMKYSAIIYTSDEIDHHLVNAICKQTKQSLKINQHEQGPLWGRT